jgi:hypothetical protein
MRAFLVPEPVQRTLLGMDVMFGLCDELGERSGKALLAALENNLSGITPTCTTNCLSG